ncbi:MAG: hypothetical protein KF822_09460 [Steroidobacteraceae bacterium]|nr:hypothetical protein [Steroidobacteraceae bacterium]
MPDAQITGGGVAAIHTAALLETLGTQKAAWSDDIRSGYIGSAAKLILKRNGTKQYETTFTGAATTDGDGNILMPGALAAPSTHLAADIDTGTWTLRIEKASDSSKGIDGTLGPPGSDANFILSKDTDGSNAITAGTIKLLAPATLDVGAGAGDLPAYSAQGTVSDMGLANDFNAYGSNTPWATGMSGGQVVPPAAVVMGNRGRANELESWWTGLSEAQPYLNKWNYFLLWMVGFFGGGHVGGNNAIKVWKAKKLARRRSDGQWVLIRAASSYEWFPAALAGATQIPGSVNTQAPAPGISVVEMGDPMARANKYVTHGLWGGINAFDQDSYDCILHAMCASLELWNPAGSDNRATSQITLQMGADYYPVNYGGALPWYPGCGLSRLKAVTPTKQWFTFANLSNARQAYIGQNASVSVSSFLNNPPPRALVEA